MIMVHLLSMVLFLACLTIQWVQAQERYITSEDITSHPSYSASLPYFLKIESEMYRIKERASFHSFVHIIPPVLELIKAVTVLEIGSYCGASLILELSIPSVQKIASLDLKAHPHRDTPGTIAKNAEKYNKHGATFHQLTGDSRSKDIITQTHDIFEKHSVDFFFIDGDHRDCSPDFYLYQDLVRPGGVIMFDDYFDKRIQRSIKAILSKPDIRKCYNVLGTPLNVANATTLKSPNPPPAVSNEFILQKKFDCVA